MALAKVSPVTHSVANTLKRVVIIVVSCIVFNTKASVPILFSCPLLCHFLASCTPMMFLQAACACLNYVPYSVGIGYCRKAARNEKPSGSLQLL
jgi:hypothetical protein